jgi:transcriptional regulator with XRE-family HTH domain
MPPKRRPKSAPQPDQRHARFAALVTRLLAAAKDRGMTIADIEAATGVGSSTWYRWEGQQWTASPRADLVRGFVEGLGGKLDDAHEALGWSVVSATRRAPEPISEDAHVRAVARALNDPNVTQREKIKIRRLIRAVLPDGYDRLFDNEPPAE